MVMFLSWILQHSSMECVLGEEIEIEIETGKTLIVKLISVGQPQADGNRVVYFELNGQPREVSLKMKILNQLF